LNEAIQTPLVRGGCSCVGFDFSAGNNSAILVHNATIDDNRVEILCVCWLKYKEK
jgi:hypothetical protein